MKKLISLITGLMTAVAVPVAMATSHDTTNLDDDPDTTQTMENTVEQPPITDLDFMRSFFEGTPESDMARAFDIRQFRAHPCFEAVGQEQDYCLSEFGVRTDFQTLLEDEAFARMILEYTVRQYCEGLVNDELENCIRDNASFLPQVLSDLDEETDTDAEMPQDEDASEPLTFRNRSQLLWEACAQSGMQQALCYQQFLRAVTDETVDMSEVASVIAGSRENDDTNDDNARADQNNGDDEADLEVQADEDEDMDAHKSSGQGSTKTKSY